MSEQTVLLTSVGAYLPTNVVTNQDLSAFVDTSDEWIQRRTGIRQRHFVADDETTADIATRAAAQALENASLSAKDGK